MVLSISNLSKQYGKLTAVNNLSLEVAEGEILGILGPNGSGKTTTLGMVLGITNPTAGSYSWFDGEAEAKARLRVGAILETPNFYPYMNAEQNLRIVGHIKGIKQMPSGYFDELLRTVNLYDRRTSLFSAYSLGMRQRLAIAGAMVGNPDVMIFDEPTNGLDPVGIAEVRHIILDIAAQGKTILMASHILDEVEKICTHVAVIKFGNLLAHGTVGSLLGGEVQIEAAAADMSALGAVLAALPSVKEKHETRDGFLLTFSDDTNAAALNRLAFERGIVLTHLIEKHRTLEEEFLQLTQ